MPQKLPVLLLKALRPRLTVLQWEAYFCKDDGLKWCAQEKVAKTSFFHSLREVLKTTLEAHETGSASSLSFKRKLLRGLNAFARRIAGAFVLQHGSTYGGVENPWARQDGDLFDHTVLD